MDDPYTTSLRLCDDDGSVSRKAIVEDSKTLDKSYLDRHNRLAAMTGHGPVAEPFRCTGHAHLAAEHIRCTSIAHGQLKED
jgi:hypothetical protein